MRNIKILFSFALVLLLFFLNCIPALAHSGKTDSKGGHRDSSTGQYHYHHGYPAHSHYDMDHNGTIDCPYQFDNKTNHSNNASTKSNNNSTKINYVSSAKSNYYSSSYANSVSAEQQDSNSPPVILAILLIFSPIWITFLIANASSFIEKISPRKNRTQKK